MTTWWERLLDRGLDMVTAATTPVGGSALDAELEAEGFTTTSPSDEGTTEGENDPPVYMGRGSRLGRTGSADAIESRERVARGRPDATRSQAIAEIYAWSPKELTDFQDQMVAAGVLDEEDIRRGVRDPNTIAAWEEMVDGAVGYYLNGIKKSPWDVIDEYTANPAPMPGSGRERAPLTVSLSNPDDVKRLMRDYAREALGSGKLDEKRLDEIVAAWHAEQRNAQTAEYNTAESGGTLVEPPSFETFADEQARATDPTGYDSRKVISGLQHVFSMFDGGA